jgi:drug/metabolite transporter (DMT)-like permease
VEAVEMSSPDSTSDLEDMETLPQWTNSAILKTESSTYSKVINAQFILLNTTSTVAIVFINKVCVCETASIILSYECQLTDFSIFTDTQLAHCQITIAIWHFLCTFLVLYIATLLPFSLSIFFAAFLLLGNLSLALNTVGFYQLAKVMTTPAVVLLNYLLFRIKVSKQMLLAITAVCVGITLVSAKIALGNVLGTCVATAAFTITALYQIWIGKKITDLDISAPQLLLNQAPVSVLLLVCMAPFIDTPPAIALVRWNILWALFGSGILASLLNLSQFLIIERTSALTFNIVSNLKSVMIVSLSWWMDGIVPSLWDLVGVMLALGGAYAYSQFSARR